MEKQLQFYMSRNANSTDDAPMLVELKNDLQRVRLCDARMSWGGRWLTTPAHTHRHRKSTMQAP